MTTVTIRRMQRADLPAVARGLPFGYGDKHAVRLNKQRRGEASYLIAWRGRRAVGHVLVNWRPPRTHPALQRLRRCPDIEDLLVHPALRGRGIGTALMAGAERLARRRGIQRLGLSVGVSDNPVARALYERLGYRDAGVGPFELGGDYIDAAGKRASWHEICLYLIKRLTARR